MDKDELKNSLSIEQVRDFVAELGGEPNYFNNGVLTCRTICHGGDSHKLYYYENTHLFKCYTDCGGEAFDIYELVCKVNHLNPKTSLYQGMVTVSHFFNISLDDSEDFQIKRLKDWDILNKYEKAKDKEHSNNKIVEMTIYDKSILTNLPKPRILPWEREGITQEVMRSRGIAYDPKNLGIVIPHYDIDNNLVGIRERTLIKEEEEYGKYKPAILNGKMYNHPLGFNLYNLNNSKNNIKLFKKAIVFESEKSCLLYASYFGIENDISVACCGSNLISHQVNLLLSLGVDEIIIALDKQFQQYGDKEWEKLTKNLYGIHDKYGNKVQISYMFDKKNLLPYKAAPIDEGKEIFLTLFKERITI